MVGARDDPDRVTRTDVGRRMEEMGYEVVPVEPGAPSTGTAG